ncbi:MAG: transporter [Endozoicomonas sp.]
MNNKSLVIPSVFALALGSLTAFAHEPDRSRPDSHAPISVMGDHIHRTGEFMFSYRLMKMTMEGMQDGSKSLSSQEVFDRGYMMTPTRMDMTMHMFGGMYASSDQLTWMAMASYLDNSMDMLNRMGVKSSMESSGLGDVNLGALYQVYAEHRQTLHLNLMTSLPTGSIEEENSAGQILPYRMQLGSGTWDLKPAITWNSQHDSFSWGAQAGATIRLGENKRDYTLGNSYQLQSWFQKPVHKNVSLAARLNWEKWDNIRGEDKDLAMMKAMTPLADPDKQGGRRVTGGLGINITLPAGNRLALEYTQDISQRLDGPQMSLDNSITLGWQLAI